MRRPHALALALAGLLLVGCAGPSTQPSAGASDKPVLRVAGATSNPLEQASIEYVRDHIAADHGITIDYVHIEETRAILEATESGEVDANVAMHAVYMNAQNEQNGFHLAAVAPLFKQHQVLYSKKFASVEDIPNGAKVAVSTSTVAQSTALKFLEQIGLVKVDPSVPLTALGIKDIVENPKNLEFVSVQSVPRALDDTDLATATAFAFYTADVDSKYEIASIDGLDDYALQLVVRQDHVSDPAVQSLTAAFLDPRLTDFVTQNYGTLVTAIKR